MSKEGKKENRIIDYDLDSLELQGRTIYTQNDDLRNIMNVMEHPEFKKFFDTYFTDWHMIKVFTMFMKVYDSLGERHNSIEDIYPTDLTCYQKIALLKNMIDDSGLRQQCVDELVEWVDNTKNIKD